MAKLLVNIKAHAKCKNVPLLMKVVSILWVRNYEIFCDARASRTLSVSKMSFFSSVRTLDVHL